VASIAMSIGVIFAYNSLTAILGMDFIGELISLATSILLGAFIYIVFIKMLKIEEMKLLEGTVKNLFVKQR
ncbi:MAG: murein biosynthesis integral membrane protein MurJ, partial [Intestinibacter sp.]|nr:murein biosynthesis integral membrane protein MurJ [Intestinibacter sp.]